MNAEKLKTVIGVSSYVNFIDCEDIGAIPARIDSGARTSSLWVSDIIADDKNVSFCFFDKTSSLFTGQKITLPIWGTRTVTSSTGVEQERYVVELSISLCDKRIRTKFTLSDRSTQAYPILIGRNTLRGHFLIDCSNPGEAAKYKDPKEQSEFNESES